MIARVLLRGLVQGWLHAFCDTGQTTVWALTWTSKEAPGQVAAQGRPPLALVLAAREATLQLRLVQARFSKRCELLWMSSRSCRCRCSRAGSRLQPLRG